MSTLYIFLPQSQWLQHWVDILGTLLAGGHSVEADQVQPIIYGNETLDPTNVSKLTHDWPKWLSDLRQNRPCMGTAIGLTTHRVKPILNSVSRWCRPHVMAYEAIAHQLPHPIQPTDSVAMLVDDASQLPWIYAICAYFGTSPKHMSAVWQMPTQALESDGCVSAAYEPQLTALQELIPVVCTGLRHDATTHAGFTLVETAAALLHAPQEQHSPLMCVSQRGQLLAYTPQHMPFVQAIRAMQRVALWDVVANHEYLMPALKRIHVSSKAYVQERLINNSPELSAMVAVRERQCQWMSHATPSCFSDGLTPQFMKNMSTKLQKAIHPLDATANDTQRIQVLLDALGQVWNQCEALFPTEEDHVAPVIFSDKPISLNLIPLQSPTAWVEQAELAFLRYNSPNDDEAKRLRQNVMALWFEFFQEEVHHAPQQLEVKEVRLSASTNEFTALKRLLPLTAAGRLMLEADIVYEVSLRQSPNVVLAISSPLTGFALAPGHDTFTHFGDLHDFSTEFVRFIDAYLRMFPDNFSPDGFRYYVECEKAKLTPEDRTDVEATRANVMAEFPVFAHHVGIEPQH